jgi:hypothetical protein
MNTSYKKFSENYDLFNYPKNNTEPILESLETIKSNMDQIVIFMNGEYGLENGLKEINEYESLVTTLNDLASKSSVILSNLKNMK